MKIITVLFLFSSSKSLGQASLPLSRTTWAAEPTGWTNSGCTQRTSSFACSGSDGTIFDTNGDSRTIFFSSAPDQLIFKLKKSTMSGESSLLVQESTNGTTWTNIGNYGTATGATAITDCGNITVTLNCLSRYVKWIYTKATGNCDMDDVSISSYVGSCGGGCTPPTTTITPTSQTICVNSLTTFSVGTSAASPSYTWEMSANNSTWTPVSNGTPSGVSYTASAQSLSVSGTSTLGLYYYHCLVSESGTCTATSASASLTIISGPSITSSPASASVTTAGTATFVAAASGSGLSYQWQVNSGSGFADVSGSVYSGGTTATLSVTSPSLGMNSYSYQCVVSNSCGTATTNVAILTVTSGPCINEAFNAGTSAPSGWTFTSIGGTYTSAGNFGNSSPSLQMNGTGDQVTTLALTGNVATQLSFWIKGQGTNAASALLVEGFDGVSWVSIDNITASIPTSGTVKTYNSGSSPSLPSNLIQFRFTYSQGAGNLSFDDVIVDCAPSCAAPTTTITPLTQTVCAGTAITLSVSSSAASPSYTWQASSNGSSWSSIANGTPSGALYSGSNTSALTVTTGSTYYYRVLVADGGTCTATSSAAQVVVNTVPSISAQPISVSTSSTGTASYTVVAAGGGTFTYQWQENNGGGFTNITNGGSNPTYAGATSSVLTISNPPMSMSGYSYQCVVSNACGTVTTNGTSTLTVTSVLTCPFIQGVLINGCTGSCGAEGNNEFVVMNSGSYSIPVNSTNLNLVYNNGSNINFTGGFTAQPSDITNLNTLAGCSAFVDASAGTIPANSTFIVMNQGSCFNNGFTDFCSAGTVYVVFSNDADWVNVGFFANTGSSTRSFITNFTSLTGGTCGTTTYTYLPDNLQNGDGASVSYSVPGGSPTYLNGTGNCAPPLAILPIELIDFYGTQNRSVNDLVWKIASEKNVLQYIIEKSEDGVNFTELTRVSAMSVEGNLLSYSCEDPDPFKGITYYRLSTLENNYTIIRHKIIYIDRENKDWSSLIYQNNDDLILEFKNAVPNDAELQLFDLSGQILVESVIKENQTKIQTQTFAEGIYFLRITTPYKTANFKLVIQK